MPPPRKQTRVDPRTAENNNRRKAKSNAGKFEAKVCRLEHLLQLLKSAVHTCHDPGLLWIFEAARDDVHELFPNVHKADAAARIDRAKEVWPVLVAAQDL